MEARLVVADAAAGSVHVYAIPSNEKLTTITGRTFADHSGMLPLRDGRLLFVDEANHELVALQTRGKPKIVGTAKLPEGEATHLAVDESGRYAVVAAAEEHDHEQAQEEAHGLLTVVDLTTYTPATIEVDSAHPGIMVSGDTVVHRGDGVLETFPIADIVANPGAHLEPTSTLSTGANGHGEAAHANGLALGATDAGLETARVVGGTLQRVRTVAWPTPGRASYVRVTKEKLVTYTSDRPGDDWPNWRNDALAVIPETGATTTAALGNGFLFRHALSSRYAGYVLHQPAGDQVAFTSVKTGQVTARVALPSLPGGPAPGQSPWEAQIRRITMDPFGAPAYVSGGGTGKISVISPDLGRVVGTITTPTSLDGGGALTVVVPGHDVPDRIGR
ncbi:YncE family protein [Nonomuraea sp. NPDC059007]|uniref:YncE family protein n=1 Tax=Nonomuraea sp. NPDC059007 TaxID=3346692 RepID=UPI0036B8B101